LVAPEVDIYLMAVPKQSRNSFVSRAFSGLLAFLFISAAYLYTFPQPNIFYAVVVLLHSVAGIVTAFLLAAFLFRLLRRGSIAARARLLVLVLKLIELPVESAMSEQLLVRALLAKLVTQHLADTRFYS